MISQVKDRVKIESSSDHVIKFGPFSGRTLAFIAETHVETINAGGWDGISWLEWALTHYLPRITGQTAESDRKMIGDFLARHETTREFYGRLAIAEIAEINSG